MGTDAKWILARGAVVAMLLFSFAGVMVTSHIVSAASNDRIRCLDNQAATYQALVNYQAEHDGRSPQNLELLTIRTKDPGVIPGLCPSDDGTRYVLDPESGRVVCRTPSHQP